MSRPSRIVLYSHDTMGLGHMRRNLLLAQALASSRDRPAILMIFGAGESQAWTLPPGTESLSLPAVKKGANGYASRALDISLETVIAIRRRIITAAIETFNPDLVVVDKVPGGLEGELRPAIRWLRRRSTARLVLGLRDVLDEPTQVRTEWIRDGSYELVATSYDAVWVYGDPALADPVREYGFGPEITRKLHYTGFLDPRLRLDRAAAPAPPESPIALCLLGGGQDGANLAHAFSDARLPVGTTGLIVAGPHLPLSDYHTLVARSRLRPDLEVRRFDPSPDALLARATHVVSMGGYNTVMEVIAHGRHALIVPRVMPRTEQLIRAERLAARGLIEVLHPDRLSSEALTAWLSATPRSHGPIADTLDFSGLGRVNLLARALLSKPAPRRAPVSRLPLYAAAAS